jgi:hypothetical protein
MSTLKSRFAETLLVGMLAGIAGGLAEVGWIAFYGAATGAPTDLVAQGVVRSMFPVFGASHSSVWLGILIHLALAIALALGLIFVIRLLLPRSDTGYYETAVVLLALVAVWAVNFFIVLPYINPDFVGLLPYGVTLVSKLLFGLSAATVFRIDRMRCARIVRM